MATNTSTGILGRLRNFFGTGVDTSNAPVISVPQNPQGVPYTKQQLEIANEAENEQIKIQAKRELVPGAITLIHIGIVFLSAILVGYIVHYLLKEILASLGALSVVLGWIYLAANIVVCFLIVKTLPQTVNMFIKERAAGARQNSNFFSEIEAAFYLKTYIMPVGILIAVNTLVYMFSGVINTTQAMLAMVPASVVIDASGKNTYQTYGEYMAEKNGTKPIVPPANTPIYRNKITHEVKSGDTISKIAIKYNSDVTAIKKANQLTSNTIEPGQKLVIPIP